MFENTVVSSTALQSKASLHTSAVKPVTHWPTLSAENVGLCVVAADKRKISAGKVLHCNAFSFDGRQCRLVCRGRRTWLLICTYLLFFAIFSGKLWHLSWNFPHLLLAIVLSSHGSNVIDFSCMIFASKHVNAMIFHKKHISISINISHCVNYSSKSRFFATILLFFFIFVLNKIRQND